MAFVILVDSEEGKLWGVSAGVEGVFVFGVGGVEGGLGVRKVVNTFVDGDWNLLDNGWRVVRAGVDVYW